MESEAPKFTSWKQSSLAPAGIYDDLVDLDLEHEDEGEVDDIDPRLKLMYLANEGDLEGIRELLASKTDVNFQDIDHRTALHVAACQGNVDVALLLLQNGAQIDVKDRWKSTPLADAIHYKNHGVIKLLENWGARQLMAPMQVKNARQVPAYEINPKDLDFSMNVTIAKGTIRVAMWRGTQVAVKTFMEGIEDKEKVNEFRDELALLQKLRHPNVIQFLGAVTQSSPMMIVTEYLLKGDLQRYLKEKGQLKPAIALRFAMDIARGMNYLHENKPEPIIHGDLETTNILLDDSGHLKVADFDVSKLLRVSKTVKARQDTCRYIAPEIFNNEEYDTKVDVFSFGLILQEMIEGTPPFASKLSSEVPKLYAANERPLFELQQSYIPVDSNALLKNAGARNLRTDQHLCKLFPVCRLYITRSALEGVVR